MTNRDIGHEYKRRLVDVFGDELVSVILFGSVARGEDTKDSDIDVMVVFKTDESREERWERAGQIAADVSYEFDTLIGVLVANEVDLAQRMIPLYMNIRTEGVAI